MSSTVPTPTIDALRARGAWSPALDAFAERDPDWPERCARMANNPWTTGVLPVKWIELICIALNAACTHRNEAGVRRHIRAALEAGATAEEILDTLKGGQRPGHSRGRREPAHPVRGSQPNRCAADTDYAR